MMKLNPREPNRTCMQVISCSAREIMLTVLAFITISSRGATSAMIKRKRGKKVLERWQCVSLDGKPRHVVRVKEMQNYKKESLPRMSKNDVPSSFRYHSCAGRKVFD